jgi:hypothetical protein
VNVLLDIIKEPSDFLRNECFEFMKVVTSKDEDMCKLFAFQGLFEILLDIGQDEEDYIVSKDCINLINNLLSEFNKNFIREVPGLVVKLRPYLNTWAAKETIEFISKSLRDKKGELIGLNQLFFTPLLEDIIKYAFPCKITYKQNKTSIALVQTLLLKNPKAQTKLMHLQIEGKYDFLDALLVYCIQGKYKDQSIHLLYLLVSENKDIQSSTLSKITARPGIIISTDSFPTFNQILNQSLEDSQPIDRLSKVLELLIYGNEMSKELALNLPLDIRSVSLMDKMSSALMIAMDEGNSGRVLNLARLFIVWLLKSKPSSDAFLTLNYSYITTLCDYMTGKLDEAKSMVAGLLGTVAIYATEGKDSIAVVKSKFRYAEFCEVLEFISKKHETSKKELKDEIWINHEVLSIGFLKEYGRLIKDVKKFMLEAITDKQNQAESELAVLVKKQDRLIEDLQHRLQMKGNSVESSHAEEVIALRNENKQLNKELLESKIQ